MSNVLLLTSALQPSAEVVPGLALLSHQVRILPAEGSALLDAPDADLLLVDGRQDLAHARDLCRLIRTTGVDVPVLLVLTEGGLTAVSHDWGMDDVVLNTIGPAELEARMRLAIGRLRAEREADDPESHVIRSGEVVVDEATYTAKLGSRVLDLTFKEFELLKYLAQHPGRVFSRQQLLQEVWGYDYFGGTRTVDVHVRRLRAKLGPEHETLIGTVRNVGYRFVLSQQGHGVRGGVRARLAGRLSARSAAVDASTTVDAVDADRLRQIADVAADSEAADGAAPIDEATWLALRNRPDDVAWWVSEDGFALVIGDDLSLAVRPSSRGRGVAALARSSRRWRRTTARLQAWSHADHPAAATLAKRHGFERVRELWVMRRPAGRPSGEITLPEDVVIRGYQPHDEEGLLRVNAASFASHPEQGAMSASDLAERMGEPWFDPAGLLVAVRRGRPARLPLDQAALPRAGRGLRRRRRPGGAGARARQGPDPRRPRPPRRPRRLRGRALRRVRQRARDRASTPASASPTTTATPTSCTAAA